MAQDATAKPKLVIVDDDPVWQTTIKAKFGKRFDVIGYTTAAAALADLPKHKPELIILDHHLYADTDPNLQEGSKVLPKVLKIHPKVPVIMLSAQEDIQIAVDVLTGGAYDYVVKQQDTWADRLNIIIRNIRSASEMQAEVVSLRLSMKRSKLAIFVLTGCILLISLIIYLYQCPNLRVLKWDPFGRAATAACYGVPPSK